MNISFIRYSALVAFAYCASAQSPVQASQQDTTCLTGSTYEAKVSHVIDADTLVLQDDRRVRIIGINAPELYLKDRREHPYAREATNRAKELLATSNNKVTLIEDQEPLDQYGRSLFHVRLRSGVSLAAQLIREGLAAQVAVSPNTRCAKYHASLERQSRTDGRGLWNDDAFWSLQQTKTPRNARGFYLITDTVKSIKQTKKNHVLTLAHGTSVLINRSLPINVQKLLSETIEVRGWLFKYHGKPALKLHDPVNLIVY